MQVVLLQKYENKTDAGMLGREVGRGDVLLSTEINHISMNYCLGGKDWRKGERFHLLTG